MNLLHPLTKEIISNSFMNKLSMTMNLKFTSNTEQSSQVYPVKSAPIFCFLCLTYCYKYRESSFVALILDETTDIAVKSQLSYVLRYVTRDGNAEERFLEFIDVSDDRTANGFYQHGIQILEDFKCADKLVAQTYNGAAVMA
ncbi:hypothetical protein PR048_033132 [Dryococelus australis]|uniref:DUF4371 domain-containing protein n=1 Tax=Dryococelus australis TaxID=614101 RepID=A0ABQ9FZD6_9NEOP|nr:hypothetical protein PR048_033132 [Dryococelus australis]